MTTRGATGIPAFSCALIAVLFACFGWQAMAQTAASSAVPKIVVGFRNDIPPFSFAAPEFNEADISGTNEEQRPYLGYVADLCYKVFDNSIYQIDHEEVSAADRFCRMRGFSPTGDECTGIQREPRIDVLCGATTVRLDDERMEAGVFSPIVFVSGVSYIYRIGRSFNDTRIGYVRGSTAERVAKEICRSDVLGRSTHLRRAGCDTGTGSSEAPAVLGTMSLKVRAQMVPEYVLDPKENHDELIKWLCDDAYVLKFMDLPPAQLPGRMYVGDRDIILGKLQEWLAKGKGCEGVRDTGRSYTYEPYAILIAKQDEELISFVQKRIYQIFSHQDGAEALFLKWFPGQRMSDPLAWQFVLNGVMEQDMLLSGEREFE